MIWLGYSLTFCTRSIKLTSYYRDDNTFLDKVQNISSRIYQSYIFYFLIDYNSIVFYNILYFW